MRILFVWTGLTSYMGDCWRCLAAEEGVSLRVLVDVSGSLSASVAFAASDVLRGLDAEIVTDPASFVLADETADIIFAVGWHSPLCRRIVLDARFRAIPKICCFDMPWRWQLRCLLAPLVLHRFLRHYTAAFVPGAVCARYARYLGFAAIRTGLFAIDTTRFQGPRTVAKPFFVYMGRDSSEKRVDDIRAAYAHYRAAGGTWSLRLYGKGLPDGFLAPHDVPNILRQAGAFVLASEFDPWPLVLLEAMSAGCPVIASDHCTNRPELGRHWHTFPCGDVVALADAMATLEREGDAHQGENRALAANYDCTRWVSRVKAICGLDAV